MGFQFSREIGVPSTNSLFSSASHFLLWSMLKIVLVYPPLSTFCYGLRHVIWMSEQVFSHFTKINYNTFSVNFLMFNCKAVHWSRIHSVNGFNLVTYLILLYLVKQRWLYVWRIWYWTLNFHNQHDQNAQVDLAFYGRPKLNDLYLQRYPYYHNLLFLAKCQNKTKNRQARLQTNWSEKSHVWLQLSLYLTLHELLTCRVVDDVRRFKLRELITLHNGLKWFLKEQFQKKIIKIFY